MAVTNYPKHAALGRNYEFPPLRLETNTKVQFLVLGALLFFAFSVFGGALTAKVTPLGGAALGGFNLLLLPAALLVFTAIARALGFKLWGKEHLIQDLGAKSSEVYRGLALLVAAVVVTYALFNTSRLVCGKFSQLPKFTFHDSLKILGHTAWMSLPFLYLAVASYCRVEAEHGAAYQPHFRKSAIRDYWNRLNRDEIQAHIAEMQPHEKASICVKLENDHLKLLIINSLTISDWVAYFNDETIFDTVTQYRFSRVLPKHMWNDDMAPLINPEKLVALRQPYLQQIAGMLAQHE